MLEKGIDFAVNVAPQIFTAAGKNKEKLQKMKDCLAFIWSCPQAIRGIYNTFSV